MNALLDRVLLFLGLDCDVTLGERAFLDAFFCCGNYAGERCLFGWLEELGVGGYGEDFAPEA